MDETKMDFTGKQSLPKVCQKPSASALRSNCDDLNWSLQMLQDTQVTSDHSLPSPAREESVSRGAPPRSHPYGKTHRAKARILLSQTAQWGNPKVTNVKNNQGKPCYNAEQRALHLSKMLERNWNSSTLVLPCKLTHRGWEIPVYEHI